MLELIIRILVLFILIAFCIYLYKKENAELKKFKFEVKCLNEHLFTDLQEILEDLRCLPTQKYAEEQELLTCAKEEIVVALKKIQKFNYVQKMYEKEGNND